MCTATWIPSEGGYELFFNRDELATRKPALPPTVREARGVRFLAPTDGDAGGTWIGVNELGISVGIANGARTARDEGPGPFRSRGLLILDLLACATIDEVARVILEDDPGRYRSFEILALAPEGEPVLFRWDGTARAVRRERAVSTGGALLVSSSRDPVLAREARLAELAGLVRETGPLHRDRLLAFHRSHAPERGPLSPCMHREDAATVSFTRIRVGEVDVELEYRPGPPCESAASVSVRLPRRRATTRS